MWLIAAFLNVESDEARRGVELAARLCITFEGFFPRPYLCPAGVPTIGIGTTRYLGGLAVSLTDPPLTLDLARELLLHDLEKVRLPAVLRLCPGLRTAGQTAAILDFAYNLGTGALAASTLRRRINAGRFDEVPGELRKWTKAAGRPRAGLVRRREAEAAVWWMG